MMLGLKRDSLRAWRVFVDEAVAQPSSAGEEALDQSRAKAVQAAQIAGRVGLKDCSRALS
jgi:hypothetical protein